MNTIEISFGTEGYRVNATITKYENKWCVLFGNNIQEGIVGFGNTISQAIDNFKIEFRNR